MYCKFFFNAEVLYHHDVGRFSYRIHARTVGDPFLLMASPGAYRSGSDALVAAECEINQIKERLFRRYLRANNGGKRVKGGAA